MMSEMEMLYLICKHVIYFLFRKAGGGGGVSMSPYRNKTTPCTGFFFCIPLAWHGEDDVARQQNPLDGPRCQDSDDAHHRHCLVFQISIVTLVLNPFVDIRCRGHITGGDIATI
jgi:hypothetical protein